MTPMAFSNFELNETEFKAATYKRGLATVEDQLVTFRKNEVLFSEEIAFLKREVCCKDYEIGLDEFKEPEFNRYGPRDTVLESTIDYDKESDNSKENTNDSLENEQVSDNENSSVESLPNVGKPQMNDKGFVDSGCSRHMTGNIAYLIDFKEFNGGYVTFGGGAYGGRITGKGTLKTDCLDFEDVHYVDELKFNLFSVSQMCDKKNYVLFTDTECLVLSPNFKLPDENQILLRIPREDNMYSFDMKNIVPKESLTCLVAKATSDESMLWHRRLGHINFKNINKLVKENLVRGLPLKHFENDQTCVACLKGKQHRASYKSKVLSLKHELRGGYLS
ncbi:ribonuclease H-like domain-containing protein [Tanacetum coccineum]